MIPARGTTPWGWSAISRVRCRSIRTAGEGVRWRRRVPPSPSSCTLRALLLRPLALLPGRSRALR
eukprot:5374227-Alexandrium_andersonii.AAC.1